VFSVICITLIPRLGHATRGALVSSTSRVVAVACCDMGWISAEHGVRCGWSLVKRLETCIYAEGGDYEDFMWHCLPDILVATHHSQFFEATNANPKPALFRAINSASKERNKPSVSLKSFAFPKLVWWHFQVGGQLGYSFFSFAIS